MCSLTCTMEEVDWYRPKGGSFAYFFMPEDILDLFYKFFQTIKIEPKRCAKTVMGEELRSPSHPKVPAESCNHHKYKYRIARHQLLCLAYKFSIGWVK